MTLIRCTEEEAYRNRLVQVVRNNLGLADNDLITHNLEYVAFSRLCDTLHDFTNFEY